MHNKCYSGFKSLIALRITKQFINFVMSLDKYYVLKYKEVSKDKKTGLESLQFPIYVQIRELGKDVSYD